MLNTRFGSNLAESRRSSTEITLLKVNDDSIAIAHLAKMSENIPQYAGVILYSLHDTPLGFGVTSFSTLQCKDLNPTKLVVFNQADLGEYLRIEDDEK